MAGNLLGRKVAVLATDGVEQVELTAPWQALKGAQAEVTLVSLKPGDIQGFIHQEKADTFHVDKIAKDVTARDFDALVIPGGVRNTEALRASPEVIQLVRGFMEADKPVAAICHAPRLLVAADAVQGRTLLSLIHISEPTRQADISYAVF